MTLDRQEISEIVKRVFARQDVIEACKRRERRDIGLIISVLGSHGISQGLIAGLTGIPQGRLSEYKTGKRQPTLNTLEDFANGLGVPEHARRALGLAPAEPAGDGAALAEVNGTAGQMPMPDLLTVAWMAGSLNNHVDRRAVLQLAATLLAAPLLGVEEPMERLAYALIGPTMLQDDTVTFLEQRTVGLHRIEPMFQARLVHRSIMDHLREVTALLEGHPHDPLRGRLARIAGESAVLAAWTAWDLGEGAHSARMYRITEAAARAADDPVIIACADTLRSYATSGPTAHEDARRLLAGAREHLPETGENATRAWVLGREAEEAAAIGDRTARDLIKRAAEAFDEAKPQKERPWTRFLDETRMNALALSTHTRLGNEQEVHNLAADLLATVTPSSKRAALINADVGIAAVRLGDVSSGLSYGHRSLEAVRVSETSFGLWRLEELARTLAQEPRARELRTEIKQARRALASHG
jgi:transcriptional regulator with XRE-family HTH domain